MDKAAILLTGGTGYIGSHVCVTLAHSGFMPVIVDNLCNSKQSVLPVLKKLCGITPVFYAIDVREQQSLSEIIDKHNIRAVMHFAALKSVSDSVARPREYFDNNVGGLKSVLGAMKSTGLDTIVYSSSATVYGMGGPHLITEDAPLKPVNPYGETKLEGENLLHSTPGIKAGILRYFNPVGAHESGEIGEDPQGKPNNLMPYLTQVAAGLREELIIHGDDYPTCDGTGVRDFIHVMDIAELHVLALKKLFQSDQGFTCNLGTGQGYSVLQMIHTFERVNNVKVPYRIGPRRDGDVDKLCADPARAIALLGHGARRDLGAMCRDAWLWQKNQL